METFKIAMEVMKAMISSPTSFSMVKCLNKICHSATNNRFFFISVKNLFLKYTFNFSKQQRCWRRCLTPSKWLIPKQCREFQECLKFSKGLWPLIWHQIYLFAKKWKFWVTLAYMIGGSLCLLSRDFQDTLASGVDWCRVADTPRRTSLTSLSFLPMSSVSFEDWHSRWIC